jgi:hypothetical protein
VALGYDDPDGSAGFVAAVAHQVATSNLVWQQAPSSQVLLQCPPGVSARCVRVNVYRNGEAGSTPVPTLFGPMLGIASQGVRATATAVVGNGNATPCLKPWAIPDDWNENVDLPPAGREFSYYDATGVPLGGARDEYFPPSGSQAGDTNVSSDVGARIIWNLEADLLNPTTPISREPNGSSGSTQTGVLPLSLPGSLSYRDNMTQCNGQPVALNQTLPIATSIIGSGEATNGMNDAMALDAAAALDISTWRIQNSCAPTCASVSPRLLAVVLYDPRKFQLGRATGDWTQSDVGCPTNNPCITVSNIVGFFLHGTYGSYGPHGHILRYPGIMAAGTPTFVDDASWLVTTYLIR